MDQGTQRLIRRHNENMRELIVRDLDALENKLNVKRQVSTMADDAMDKVKGTLGMNSDNRNGGWGSFVRHNAAPLLAVGLGGSVLARNLRERVSDEGGEVVSSTPVYYGEQSFDPTRETATSTESDGLRDKAASKAGELQESTSERLDDAKERASETGRAVGEKATHAREVIGEKAGTAKENVTVQAVHAKEVVVERIPSRGEAKQMAHEHSQLLGLAALAVGAAAGTLIPRSRAEERRLAPMQSQAKDKASELVDDSVEKAKEAADRAKEAVSAGAETAKEEFQDSGDDEPPSGGTEGDMPDLTRPNRITGSRTTAQTSVDGGVY